MAASILVILPVLAITAIPAQPQALTREARQHALSQAQAVSEFTTAVNRYGIKGYRRFLNSKG